MSNRGIRNVDVSAVTEQLTAMGEQGLHDLKEKAGAVAEHTKTEVAEKADEVKRQMEAAAERLDQVSDVLRRTGQELYAYYEEELGSYAEAAAEQVDHLSKRLKQRRAKADKLGIRWLMRRPLLPVLLLAVVLVVGSFLRQRSR
jgi:hypothetical protein